MLIVNLVQFLSQTNQIDQTLPLIKTILIQCNNLFLKIYYNIIILHAFQKKRQNMDEMLKQMLASTSSLCTTVDGWTANHK